MRVPTIKLSSPVKVDLVVYKGDSGKFRITLIPPAESDPIDISAAAFDADIRMEAAFPDTLTSFEVVPVEDDPASIDIILSAEKSELLYDGCVYDVEMRVGDEVSTIIYGTITVTQDVSRP